MKGKVDSIDGTVVIIDGVEYDASQVAQYLKYVKPGHVKEFSIKKGTDNVLGYIGKPKEDGDGHKPAAPAAPKEQHDSGARVYPKDNSDTSFGQKVQGTALGGTTGATSATRNQEQASQVTTAAPPITSPETPANPANPRAPDAAAPPQGRSWSDVSDVELMHMVTSNEQYWKAKFIKDLQRGERYRRLESLKTAIELVKIGGGSFENMKAAADEVMLQAERFNKYIETGLTGYLT